MPRSQLLNSELRQNGSDAFLLFLVARDYDRRERSPSVFAARFFPRFGFRPSHKASELPPDLVH